MPALIQRPAPSFSGTVVEKSLFKQISLKDFEGKWLVLFFYPMDFTFVCPTEILAFNKALPEFAEINTSVIACSTDSEYSHLAWANLPQSEGGLGPNLDLPLLADRNHKIARDYGVLLEEEGITLRGLFIIDPSGKLRQSTINDLPVGRSVEETIRLIKAFQYVEIHGEGCPANWDASTNSATIKLDPKGKLEWFEKNKLTNGHAQKNGHAKVNGKRTVPVDEDAPMNGVDEGTKRVKA
ncbi:cTPxI [Tulasnella sp. JGI-2019a]|nr:cTPxI [Tulasnella sp. JGI-2019a]KAG9013709.1 cTPxI [Tulasnella sp. JGI-2019a]